MKKKWLKKKKFFFHGFEFGDEFTKYLQCNPL